jgi:hypothetical protein
MKELHTYLSLLLGLSIFLHPHHNILQSLSLGVAGALIFLELSCLSAIPLEVFALGAAIMVRSE